jgi:3-(3-hydroxy-phenyl)propionate hydroxylase
MTYDVIILGLGPVGATLANLLARAGLRIAVVEQRTNIYDKPRAITLDHEVMRVMQACGVARALAPFTAPHPGTHYLGVDGQVIKVFDPLPPPFPLGWIPTGTFVQPQLEALLRRRLREFPRVDWFLGSMALDLCNGADGACLTLQDPRGQETLLRGRWLAACDGANSFARRRLGIGSEDLEFDEWWMVVDARVKGPVDLPAKCIQYCWPSRPATFIPGPGSLRRWEIKLLPGEDPEGFDRPDNVAAQLARFVDTSRVEVWRSAVYRFHAILAERWRDDRIFLVGDAAHQTPPFLGQGMCAGIRDAANLAWKLALVVRRDAEETLLDSYERERKPHVRAVVAAAKEFGTIIGELDPHAARARDARLRGQLERGEAETIRQRYIPDLDGGVIDPDGSPAAGALFVQPRCATKDGSELLDDLVPGRFLIVSPDVDILASLGADARSKWKQIGGACVMIADAETRVQNLRAHGLPADLQTFNEQHGLFRDWLQRCGATAAVVRPDRYVFGTATGAQQLERLVGLVVEQVFGQRSLRMRPPRKPSCVTVGNGEIDAHKNPKSDRQICRQPGANAPHDAGHESGKAG